MANERGTAAQWVEPDPEAVAPVASLVYLAEVDGQMHITDDAADATHMWARHGDGYLVVVPFVAAQSRLARIAGYVLPMTIPDA